MRVSFWLDRVLVALFCISVLTSKAGIYISSSLLLVRFFLFFLEGKLSEKEFFKSPILWAPFAIFVIGSFSTLLSNGLSIDFFEFSRKCALILVIPPLAIIFRDKSNKDTAIYFLVITFLVCAVDMALQIYQFGWHGRVSSFLDVGRWGELVTYMVALFLPYFTCQERSKRLVGTLVLVLGVAMIITTGSRAPIVALAIVTPFYLLYKDRKAALRFSAIIITGLLCFVIVSPKNFHLVLDRVASISNSSDDWSNLARLSMWDESRKFLVSNLSSSTKDFLFGTGVVSFEEKYKDHLTQNYDLSFYSEHTNGQFSFSDSHNMYLDMMNKNGVIFFVFWICAALAIIYKLFSLRCNRLILDDGLLLVLMCFATIGIFYTSHMSYQTSFIYLSIALAMSHHEMRQEK